MSSAILSPTGWFRTPESDSTDELFKSSAYLTDAYLLNNISKHSALPSAAPFNLAFQVKSRFFSWLEEKGNEMRLKRFSCAMTGTAGFEDGGSVSQPDGEEISKAPLGVINPRVSKDLTGRNSGREASSSTLGAGLGPRQ